MNACVGDTTATTDGGPDATPDTTIPPDGGGDATPDVAPDAPPAKCVFPEGGASGTLDQGFATQIYSDIANPMGATADSAGNLYVSGFENANFVSVCRGVSDTAASIVKITPQGTEETTFGTTSHHLCLAGPAGTTTVIEALAYDPTDGTILGAGVQTSGTILSTGKLLVIRFDTAGHLVTTFGASGQKVIDAVSGKASLGQSIAVDTSANPAKIVVSGSDGWLFGPTADTAFVVRLNHDGSPDLGFNSQNPLLDTSSFQFTSTYVDPSGAIYVAGARGNVNNYTPTIRKVTNAGAWDSSFNGGSPVAIPLTSGGFGEAWGVTGSGQEVTVGVVEGSQGGGVRPVALAGYQPNGSPGSAPAAVTINSAPLQVEPGYFFGMLSRDCEGRALVGGFLDEGDAGYHSVIGRYEPDGGVDTTFGTNGFGTVVNINAAPGTAPVEDPVTGRILVPMRARDPGQVPKLAVGRLYR